MPNTRRRGQFQGHSTKITQRAPKGHRATPAAPSIEELCGIMPDRHRAFRSGLMAALFDELVSCLHVALRAADRRNVENMPVLPDGSRDARIQSNDPVTIPYWAFCAVNDLVIREVIEGTQGRTGRHARWQRKYRDNLIHWHRYALVKKATEESRAKWPPGEPDVYDIVSQELAGTAFAAKRSGIKKSVEEVVMPALKNGQHDAFYRSTADHYYNFLLNLPGETIILV